MLSRLFAPIAVAIVLATLTSCADTGTDVDPDPGVITGQVLDAQDAGIAGTTLALTGDGVDESTQSGANGGFAFTGVPAGGVSLAVTPPTGYTVAASQANPVSITVAAGDTASVTIRLQAVEDTTGTGTGGGEPTDTVQISMGDNFFDPSEATIDVGTLVVWTNDGNANHTTTANSGAWGSGTMSPGAEADHHFTTAGSYPYRCNFHSEMTGTITVE